MDSSKAKMILEILAELMDEQSEHTGQETKALTLYNKMRQEIHTGLIPAVESISYEKKYAVIDRANHLADTIGLYLNYPELVNKYVIGYYAPGAAQAKSVCDHYLRPAAFAQKLGSSGKLDSLSHAIPTILAHGEEHGQIRALNLAGKQVPLSLESYAVLEPRKYPEVELTGVLAAYCLSSPAVRKHQSILLLPKGMDWQQDYCGVLVHALDMLVVPCAEMGEPLVELLRSGNVKLIVATGRCNDIQRSFLTALAGEIKSSLMFVSDMSDVYKILQEPERNVVTNNFSNTLLMESCLCSVLWYLAEQKKILNTRTGQINRDLLGGDQEAHAFIKELQKTIGAHVKELDRCADAYYASMQKILKQIEEIQQLLGGPSEDALNGHAAMGDHLLDLLAAECTFFLCYGKSNANDHILNLEALCERAGCSEAVVRVLVGQWHSRPQVQADLEAFAKYATKSSLLLKKKLEMHQLLKLSVEECVDIISRLDMPLSPMEYRLLGEAQHERGQLKEARENLKRALAAGDKEAGEFLYRKCKTAVPVTYLADNGVAEAAYTYGESVYQKEYAQTGDKNSLQTVMKYLHIAAAQGHVPAMELLGNIWFDRAMAVVQKDLRKEYMKTALSYYSAVQQKAKRKKAVQERMGVICFEQEDYQRAKSCLEDAKTPQAFFLLGGIYEHGHGVAADRDKALEYYEKAVGAGHSQAQVEYARLYAEVEAEKAKTTIDSYTSYYSSSYYSGYYSSYYSGW